MVANESPKLFQYPPPRIQSPIHMTHEPPGFLDVPWLLERSEPRARHGWLGYAAGIFVLLVLLTSYLSLKGPAMAGIVQAASAAAMVLVMMAMIVITFAAARRQRAE